MLTLDKKTDTDSEDTKPLVSGKWFEIRLSPDIITGEILNIGVGFIQSRSKKFYFKMLDSAMPFVCLYGLRGREQFGFLLSIVRESLSTHGPSAKISPHISFGDPRNAQGESVDALLDNLYNTVVTLGRRSTEVSELLTPEERQSPRSTESIRKRIRKAFRKNDPNGFLDYWHDDPIVVPVDGRHRQIDMQIWRGQPGLFNPKCFGSIVSTCYKDPHYRKAYLNGAYHDLTVARSLMTKDHGSGGIFILRPQDNDTQVENEIDNTVWVLERNFSIKSFIEYDIEKMKNRALEFSM